MTFDQKVKKLETDMTKFARARHNPNSVVVELETTYNKLVKQFQKLLPDIYLNTWLDTPKKCWFKNRILYAIEMCKNPFFVENAFDQELTAIEKDLAL